MKDLKNYSNLELIKELMERSISHDEIDEICKTSYPVDKVTIEEFATDGITIRLWHPKF